SGASAGYANAIRVDATTDVNSPFSVFIGYVDDQGLRVARRTPTGWSTSLPLIDPAGGSALSLTSDSQGFLHAAYSGGTLGGGASLGGSYATNGLRLVSPAGGEVWTAGNTETVRFMGFGPVDIHLLDGGTPVATLATQVTTNLVSVTVPEFETRQAELLLVRQGVQQGAWTKSPLFTVARGHDIDWVIQSGPEPAQASSMVIDANGDPHVVYISSSTLALRYSTRRYGSWVTTTVDSSGNASQYCDIGLDSAGAAHIVYYDGANDDLRYAKCDDGSCSSQAVDTSGDVGSYCRVAVGSNDKVYACYYDATNEDCRYATDESGGWVTETVDAGGSVGTWCDIDVDGSNTACVSYYDRTNSSLKVACRSAGWV
ncbi:MAG: hypothetical protein R3246_16470, partial [Acidimicrobiia bacterium]|nr:hypothetical protein [Acidimicrobiia bacterium]